MIRSTTQELCHVLRSPSGGCPYELSIPTGTEWLGHQLASLGQSLIHKIPSGSLICHDGNLEGCQPHKDLLIPRIFLNSGWTWNSRGQKTKRKIPFSQTEAVLFYSMSSLHTCASKVIQEEGTPPDLHEPQRAWPGRQTGVARYLIMSPTMDRKRSMNQVNPVQESGPIHHPRCQPAFLELCPEIGCQILCMPAAGRTPCSPHAQGNEWLHCSIHTEQGPLQLMVPTHA